MKLQNLAERNDKMMGALFKTLREQNNEDTRISLWVCHRGAG